MRQRADTSSLLLSIAVAVLAVAVSAAIGPQQGSTWLDPSPHRSQMIEVEPDVAVEVLDWGGSGRATVLLAGGGNTAHVFDDFAPPLTAHYHVYGITRRGYGASSKPGSGYGVDRLADDIAAVIERLKLERPVLMGHSFAGDEVSNVISSSETSQASGVACNQGFFLRPRPSLKLALALPGGLGIRRLFHIDERQRRS